MVDGIFSARRAQRQRVVPVRLGSRSREFERDERGEGMRECGARNRRYARGVRRTERIRVRRRRRDERVQFRLVDVLGTDPHRLSPFAPLSIAIPIDFVDFVTERL